MSKPPVSDLPDDTHIEKVRFSTINRNAFASSQSYLGGRPSMEHRGVEYRIVQGIKRGFWKWSVETETGTKSGTSDSKDASMNAARRVIDNALNPKKRKHSPPA